MWTTDIFSLKKSCFFSLILPLTHVYNEKCFSHILGLKKVIILTCLIILGEHVAAPPLRPLRPITKTTQRGKITDATKTTPPTDVETFEEPIYDDSSRYLGAIVIILSALLVVLCLLFAIYLYHYHGNRVKQLMHWNQQHQKSSPVNMSTSKPVSPTYPPPSFDPPVPPPRTKRLSQTLSEVTSFEPSVISSYTR